MLASFLVVPTALLFVARMHEPYMDEIFHVPQVIQLLSITTVTETSNTPQKP
jgi:hypothetical protein